MLCRGIRHQRLKIGLTQTELAERIGVRQAAISEYESGEKVPGVENLIRLADALNCSLDELCERKETLCH